MSKELRVRKIIRLKGYDYSREGCYFVTFCVKNKYELLGWVIVGSGFHARLFVKLNDLGIEVRKAIEYLCANENDVTVPKYVIMSNHIHMIVVLGAVGHEMNMVGDGTPTLHAMVGRIKSYTAKRWSEMCNTRYQTIWQRSFHDHIIRNEFEYQKIWQYIDENPAKWSEDGYYTM